VNLIFRFAFLILLSVSCVNQNDVAVSELSAEVRAKFKKQLKKIDPINYYRILGRKPSDSELELGRMLFNDPILSRNNDTSCATCHLSNHGFADGNPLNVGSMGRGGPSGDTVGASFAEGVLSNHRHFGSDGFGFKPTRKMFRNSLSTINVAFRHNKSKDEGLLWDGRFGNLFFQVLLPIHTPEELCGQNPLPVKGKNPFEEGMRIFRKPINLTHTHFNNPYTGENKNLFNFQKVTVKGVPRYRKDGQISYPSRNECLAIALGKLNSITEYRSRFKEVYKKDIITDKLLGIALTSFVITHVSKNAPYDKFVGGENSLNEKELYGLGMFMTPTGKTIQLSGKTIPGAGCMECHAPPQFGGTVYKSLRVKSDQESILTFPQNLSRFNGGFFNRQDSQRGTPARCHIEGVSVLSNVAYAPDIGRANATNEDEDCFKFRSPVLRNVIETFPYYHHGTEQAQSHQTESFKEQAKVGLENVIRYHLRGPIDLTLQNQTNNKKAFFDNFFQIDPLIPVYKQNFGMSKNKMRHNFTDNEVMYLLEFVANGLWDKDSTQIGDRGNDVSHPRTVPSGLSPSVTRDIGTQIDIK
jgi:cytochrome c peroxidase